MRVSLNSGLTRSKVRKLGRDLGAGINRPVGLVQGDVGMVAAEVLDGELRQRRIGRAGRDGHLPEPLGSRRERRPPRPAGWPASIFRNAVSEMI